MQLCDLLLLEFRSGHKNGFPISEIFKRNKLIRSLKDWFCAVRETREKFWRHEQVDHIQ